MKLVRNWKDPVTLCDVSHLQVNDLNILSLKNSPYNTLDLTLALKAGLGVEGALQIPNGCSHLISFLLAEVEIKDSDVSFVNSYEAASTIPPITLSGSVDANIIYLTSHTHTEGLNRAIELLKERVNQFAEITEEQLELVKKLFLEAVELNSKVDIVENLAYMEEVWGDSFPDYTLPVLGAYESIDQITVSDLHKFINSLSLSNDVVVAIQSSINNKDLSSSFEEVTLPFTSRKQLAITQSSELSPQSIRGSLYQEDMDSHVADLRFFFKKENGARIKVLNKVIEKLIHKLALQILRSEEGLIYDTNVEVGTLLPSYSDLSITVYFLGEHVDRVTSFVQRVVSEQAMNFLGDDSSKEWLDSEISRFIFPVAADYNEDYTELLAESYLSEGELLGAEDLTLSASKIILEDARAHLETILSGKEVLYIAGNKVKEL